MSATGESGGLTNGLSPESGVALTLPSTDVDSTYLYKVGVAFHVGGNRVVAVIIAGDELPKDSLDEIVLQLAHDLAERDAEDVTTLRDLARGTRWVVVRMLRDRIRSIEASVRSALADEHVSSADYQALRDYPERLAKVEQLVLGLPEPVWQSYRQRSVFDIPPLDQFPKTLAGVAEEARTASARLSGLISSQQVVIAQRQAAETERFQRLLTLVGTAVLVPGLVAAVFGANVGFPGAGSRAAFWAMLLFMVGAGLGSYAVFRAIELKAWSTVIGWLSLTWLRKIPENARLVIFTAAALAALAGAVVILAPA